MPGAIDLGRTYLGDWLAKARRAARDAEGSPGAKVDAGEAYRAVERLQVEMAAEDPNMTGIDDGIRASERAADRLPRARRAGDSRSPHPMVRGYSRAHGSGSKPVTPSMVMEAASRFWSERSGRAAPTRGATPARMTPDQINEVNRRFWAARAT